MKKTFDLYRNDSYSSGTLLFKGSYRQAICNHFAKKIFKQGIPRFVQATVSSAPLKNGFALKINRGEDVLNYSLDPKVQKPKGTLYWHAEEQLEKFIKKGEDSAVVYVKLEAK
jgi:hypothetical protein